MYKEEDLVCIAKRENNNKRNYLVVNKLQAKHIPVSPSMALDMFSALAERLKKEYANETLLLVGFAETATAIGASVAASLGSYYMQTTRETIKDVDYLFFSESHSHAMEQKLIKTDLDKVIDAIDRIIFIEDEVTTGNTILNIVDVIEKQYAKKIHFSVASLLNGMNEGYQEVYKKRRIQIHYLVKTNHDLYEKQAARFTENGQYVLADVSEKRDQTIKSYEVHNYVNARRLVDGRFYKKACEGLWETVSGFMENETKKKILILGTEEFMYPAIFVGAKLEQRANVVKCHATTRSPIAVNVASDYPLQARYELVSLYDSQRKTFIYNLDKYDKVLILTDSRCVPKGLNSLVNTIRALGNKDVSIVRWC